MDKETSEIVELTGRISRDPKSKLFVPLAEEYRKAGDIEMAIHVLLEGLKNNPDYVTARSSLGKFLLVKGDLAGAQKEFEDVVKAIPDNFMAQRKLGDISVVQNRTLDALAYYKTALSLNPKDKELASLVLDVEAGQDVRSKIHLSKAITTAEQAAKQEPPAPAAAREPAPEPAASPVSDITPIQPVESPPISQTSKSEPVAEAVLAPASVVAHEPEADPVSSEAINIEPIQSAPEPDSLPVSGVEPINPVEIPPVLLTASTEPLVEEAHAPAPASLLTETEEPEEVLIVEPLEPENAVPEPPLSGVDFPGEEEHDAMPAAASEKSFDFDFSPDSNVQEEPSVSENFFDETAVLNVEDRETIHPDVVEETSTEEIVAAESVQELSEKAPEQELGIALEASDDFTTDTLAELYISQGFYEKAIEIYERMLADRPNSRGLQDKLARVRADAAQTAAPAAEQEKAPDISEEQEAREDVPVAEAGDVAAGPSVFDEWEAYRPQQEVKTHDSRQEEVAEVREDVPTIEPEEVVLEAEVIAEPGESGPGETSPGPMEYKPEAEPEEQTTAAGDAGFDVLAAPPVQEQVRKKPQFTDFEPREYLPPEVEREPQKQNAGKAAATPLSGIIGRKETIARLETWLTTIKKEK